MLSPPQHWPPEQWKPKANPHSLLFRIPLFGSLFRSVYEWRGRSEYRFGMLFPIEQELTRSVVERPPADLTLLSGCEREILQLLAIAFKESRGVTGLPARGAV